HAIAPTELLPGVRDAIGAVHARGGKVIVITAKETTNAQMHIEHLGLPADEVLGLRYADGKTDALREHGASVYVGDHLSDVRAAQRAGVLSVAVTTGPFAAEALTEAGADVVLPNLIGFPDWLAGTFDALAG